MENSIYDFLKAVDESNRANIMALRYAESILEDFINLSPDGRKIMTDRCFYLDFAHRRYSCGRSYYCKGK